MAGYSGVYGDVGLFADHNVENHIVNKDGQCLGLTKRKRKYLQYKWNGIQY